MKKSLNKELGKLCMLCHEISTTMAHDVFFQYNPHIDCFSIDVCTGGWHEGAELRPIVRVDKINYKNINSAKAKLKKYKGAKTQKGILRCQI